MRSSTQKIVTASMMAALACVATMIIKIPSPLKGYLNLGDCIVLLSGWLLSPMYGFLSAGIGSMLADVFSGYVMYAPATFFIKGLMAIIAHYIYKNSVQQQSRTALVFSGILAEGFMVLGYLAFESILYGFLPSLVNVPANGLQGAVGIALGIVLVKIFEKTNIVKE